MTTLYLLGAGSFGAEVADICDTLLATDSAEFDNYLFLDDDGEYLIGKNKAHLHAGAISEHAVSKAALYICTVGSSKARSSICQSYDAMEARWINIIHPTALISSSAKLGHGVVACANTFISTYVKFGDHVHLNVGSTVGHDSEIGNHCTFSSHVDITGNCKIGDSVFFGSGSRVLPGKKVGDNVRIGAGCVIGKNVVASSVYYAPQAKRLW